MSTMLDFLNKALLSSIISDALDEYAEDPSGRYEIFYIYDTEKEEFCESGSTMYGIPIFNTMGVQRYLEAYQDVLAKFIVFRPNEQQYPDMEYPVMTGLEIMQELNKPQETGGLNALCSIPHR